MGRGAGAATESRPSNTPRSPGAAHARRREHAWRAAERARVAGADGRAITSPADRRTMLRPLKTLKKLTRRGALQRRLALAAGRTVTLLGASPASQLKDAIRIQGFLDYPGAPIKMVVDSPVQLGRLHACQKEPETIAWL